LKKQANCVPREHISFCGATASMADTPQATGSIKPPPRWFLAQVNREIAVDNQFESQPVSSYRR
jgi:hypothetical protein